MPTFAATPTPFSAIAAVGAMIPIESAIVSQKRSSRRSPRVPRRAHVRPATTVSGRNIPTTQFGTSTTSWIRRSQATEHSA